MTRARRASSSRERASAAVKRRVRVWLADHGKTQTWLAEQAEIGPSHLSQVLNGTGSRPSNKVARRLEAITGIRAIAFTPAKDRGGRHA